MMSNYEAKSINQGVEEEKRVGTHLIACAIELAHLQMHASYREVHSPREVAM